MADDIGGLSVSFTAEAAQLQSELRRMEERLRQFDRAHGIQKVRLQADLQMPGQRTLDNFRRDVSKGVAAGGGLRIRAGLELPARQELDRFSASLGSNLKTVTVKVKGVWAGWEKPPPREITVNGRGSGGGGGAATPAGPPVRAPAAPTQRPTAERPFTQSNEMLHAREQARRRERSGPVAPAPAPPRRQTAQNRQIAQMSANSARAAAQKQTASRGEVFRDWSDQELLGEFLDTQRKGGSGQWMAKAKAELVSRGFNPAQPRPSGGATRPPAGGARGYTGELTWGERLANMPARPVRRRPAPLVLNTRKGGFSAGAGEAPVERVDPRQLSRFRELDREVSPRMALRGAGRKYGEAGVPDPWGPNYLNKLTEQIRQQGIKKPLRLEHDEAGQAQVTDGNHRLAAALRLGLKDVPIQTYPAKGLLTGNTGMSANPGATTAAGIIGARGFAAGPRGGALPHYSTTGVFPPEAATVGAMGRRGELTMPARDIYDPYVRGRAKPKPIGVVEAASIDENALVQRLHKIIARATPEGVKAGRGWYGRAGGVMEGLGQGTGGSRSQVLGAGAVFSTNAGWSRNISNAQDFFDAIRSGGTTFEQIAPKVKSTGRVLRTALEIFQTPDAQIEQKLRGAKGLKNPKLTEFYRGLSGVDDAFTVDRHQAMMMAGRPVASDLRAHEPFQRAGRRVAKDLGWSARDTQAASWVTGLGHEIAGADPYEMQRARPQAPRVPARDMRRLHQATLPEWGGFTYDPHQRQILQPEAGRATGPYVSGVGRTTRIGAKAAADPAAFKAAVQKVMAENAGLIAAGRSIGGFHSSDRGEVDLDAVKVDQTLREAIRTQKGRGPDARGAYDVATGRGVFAANNVYGEPATDTRRLRKAATPAGGAPNIAAFMSPTPRGLMVSPGEHIDPVTGTPTAAANEALARHQERERLPSERYLLERKQEWNRQQAAQQRVLARYAPAPQVGLAAYSGRLSGPARDAMARAAGGDEGKALGTFIGGPAPAGGAAGPAPAAAAQKVARKMVSEAIYEVNKRQYTESEFRATYGSKLSEDQIAAARVREAKYEQPAKAAQRQSAMADVVGPPSLDPATLRRAGISGAFPEAQRAQSIVAGGQATLRESQGLQGVRAPGTTIAQQLATMFGGRPQRQEAQAELGRQLSIIKDLTREGSKGGQAFNQLAVATEAHTEAVRAGAPDISKQVAALEQARAVAVPYAEVLERAEARVGMLQEKLRPGVAAFSGLATSMVGSIIGMTLFSTVTGAMAAAGEKLSPVLQENADRVSGFQTNANRMRATLAESVREMHGYSELAVGMAGANIGMSRSTLDLIRPTLAADAAIEAGNKNLEQRIEMMRAFQGVQTRQAGLTGVLAGTPAGVTQTQGGMNILGLQTGIGGTPSTFEQLGRQFQFGATPGLDLGEAAGFGPPKLGERPFDLGRDIEDPVRDALSGVVANATAIIPVVGDFFKSIDEQNEAMDAARDGLGEFTTEMAAGAAVLRTDFNDAVQRAGGSALRMAEVTDKSRVAQEAQIAALEGSGIPSVIELGRGLRAGRTVLEGVGQPGTTAQSQQQFLDRVVRGVGEFARGSTLPDPAVVAEQTAKTLSAQLQLTQWQGQQQRQTLLPGAQYLQGLASGRNAPGGARRGGFGIRETPGDIAKEAPNYQQVTGALTELQKKQESVAQTGRSQLITMLGAADASLSKATGSASNLTGEFTALEQSLGANGAAMRGLQIENMWAQANLQVAQYDEQLRIASRSLKDAVSFQTGAGSGDLGLLQRRARSLEIASAELGFQQQALGLQSQSLGLQNAHLGIRSRELGFQTTQLQIQSRELGMQSTALSLMQRQRQINFQTALAGFTAPGMTGAERAARQDEARIEAEFAQRQQDIATGQFGIEQQVFDIEKQQLPIAQAQLAIDTQQVALQGQSIVLAQTALGISREAFNVQQAMVSVNAARAVEDLRNQIDLLTQARTVTVQVAVNSEAIAAYQEAIDRDVALLQSVIEQAYGVQTQIMQGAAQLAAEYGRTLSYWNTTLLNRLGQYLTGVSRVFGSVRGASTLGAPTGQTGGAYDNSAGTAAGYYGSVSGPTQFTVGEAGTETVAIVRNARNFTMQPTSGGGGMNVVVDVHDNQLSGNASDMDALAAIIARKVEEQMGRKISQLGLGTRR